MNGERRGCRSHRCWENESICESRLPASLALYGLEDAPQTVGMPWAAETVAAQLREVMKEHMAPDDAKHVDERVIAQQRSDETPSSRGYHNRRHGGEIRWVQTSAVAITYQDSAASQAVLRAVTDRKRVEEALEQRDRELSALNRLFQKHLSQRFEVVTAYRRVIGNLERLAQQSGGSSELTVSPSLHQSREYPPSSLAKQITDLLDFARSQPLLDLENDPGPKAESDLVYK